MKGRVGPQVWSLSLLFPPEYGRRSCLEICGFFASETESTQNIIVDYDNTLYSEFFKL
jgi:hypothetical protein